MLATEKFVFVHLPRSGGTFVSEVIRKFFPSVYEVGHHTPRRLLPVKYSNVPVLGTVRNPWDFYVSWYHYVLPKETAGKFVAWMNANGTLDFVGSIQNLINIAIQSNRTDTLMNILPNQIDYRERYIPTITKTELRSVIGSGVGYYSFRFNELFGNPNEMFICKVESLRQDLLTFFETIGVANEEIREYVLGSEKKNASEHLHYSHYYTPELADLVSVRDRSIIERFGYCFEKEPLHKLQSNFTGSSDL